MIFLYNLNIILYIEKNYKIDLKLAKNRREYFIN